MNEHPADRAHAAIRLIGLLGATCLGASAVAAVGFVGLIMQVGI